MKRILVTGANGQLGAELLRIFTSIADIETLGTTRDRLNLSDPDSIRRTIAEFAPDIVISCAAYTAVDKAETEVELAHQINAVAPGIIATEVAQRGAKLIHV